MCNNIGECLCGTKCRIIVTFLCFIYSSLIVIGIILGLHNENILISWGCVLSGIGFLGLGTTLLVVGYFFPNTCDSEYQEV